MKATGIVVEYNPFHYGHLYHIEQARKITNCDVLIAVMSGHFTQRGEPAIADKWTRARTALEHGVDLVIELPFAYSCQSADYFALGAIEILNHLHINSLVFGSETNNVDEFIEIARTIFNQNDLYEKKVREYMNQGYRYPNACNEALRFMLSKSITSPNDLLAYSYVKAIVENNYSIKPISIQRTNDFHAKEIQSKITSATSIRNAILLNQDINEYTPMDIEHPIFLQDFFDLLYYQLLLANNLESIHLVDEGLENLLSKHILQCRNMDELIDACTCRRYTSSRIKRSIISILLNHTRQEHQALSLDYIRVLGMNDTGRQYLHYIKKDTDIPIITSFSQAKSNMLDLEFKATRLYGQAYPIELRQELIEKEYKNHAIILNK